MSSGDVPELTSTQDIDKSADFVVTAICTAVDKVIRDLKQTNAAAVTFNFPFN